MSEDFLTADEAKRLVDSYWETEGTIRSAEELLNSGAIPRLKGYVARNGKVSDSIFGGKGNYKDGTGFENPPLNAKDGTPLRLMVRTQRISTHDVQRGEIPFKDQILAMNHNHMRRMLMSVIGTSQYNVNLPDSSVVIAAENLDQIPFENVLRAYIARSSTSTSLYVHYMNGKREFCGHKIPEGIFPNGPLPYVMDTPSTKSDEHDESVSPYHLFGVGICTPEQYAQIRNASLFAFGMVHQFLYPKGIIPVDTKTEHGTNRQGKIVSQDEIWTMDSSRFWPLDDYETQYALFTAGKDDKLLAYLKDTQPGLMEKDYMWNDRVAMCPRSWSKEFARGFSQGDRGYTQDQAKQIAVRYIEGIQYLLGRRFEPDMRSHEERVVSGINTILDELAA